MKLMGLDQYIYKCTKEDVTVDENLLIKTCSLPKEEMFYYRKFPSLQGWMNGLYFRRGGSEMFNNVPLLLTKEDLLELRKDLEEDTLPETKGFFFGRDFDFNSMDKSEREYAKSRYIYTQKFIDEALRWTEEGWMTIYDSSW